MFPRRPARPSSAGSTRPSGGDAPRCHAPVPSETPRETA
jgi:hypothetical protein